VSELTLLVLRCGVLLRLGVFVFAVGYALPTDLFGQRVRRMPTEVASALPAGAAAAPRRTPAAPREPATLSTAKRLVDSGRITQDEAAVHPRRSVLMRVLGDVDSSPEIDTTILDTKPGDRWLICSDGLSSYVSNDKIAAALKNFSGTKDATNRLVRESLDQGAPDNVTVVVVDVGDGPESSSSPPLTVGSAALPLTYEADSARRALRLPTLLLHPLKSTQHEDSHFEPESEEYLDELILEDKRRALRRKITWLVGILLIIAAIVVALLFAYRWTQPHYYVGANGETVAIFQGVQQDLGPISLHSVYQQTSIKLEELTPYTRSTVEDTISATDLDDARAIIERLASSVDG
jgi:protein phosphatase